MGCEGHVTEVCSIRHPDPLALAGNGLGSAHIREHDVTIEVALVDKPGWSVETGASAENPLPRQLLALLPHEDLGLVDASVERNHGKLREGSQLLKLGVECCKHRVADRAGLVNADSQPCKSSSGVPRVNVGVATVDPANRVALGCTLAGLYEGTKHRTPVHASRTLRRVKPG